MSIIIAVVVNDHKGYKDMIFASDGRAIEHGTSNIRNEDIDKVKNWGLKRLWAMLVVALNYLKMCLMN